jgi:hypothetical protein
MKGTTHGDLCTFPLIVVTNCKILVLSSKVTNVRAIGMFALVQWMLLSPW